MTNALLDTHPCPHCGRQINAGGLANHRRTCARLPSDAEIIKEYNRLGNLKAVGDLYGVGYQAIKTRIVNAGAELIESPAYKAAHKDRKPVKLWERTFKVTPGKDRCKRCPALKTCRVFVFDLGLAVCEAPDYRQLSRWTKLGLTVEQIIDLSDGFLKKNGYQ